MLTITDSDLRNRLSFDNPWWDSPSVPPPHGNLKRRLYFWNVHDLLTGSLRRAIVLYGPRRVGKTVLMHQCIESLLSDHVASAKVLYVSLDNPAYAYRSLDRIIELFVSMHGHSRSDRLYLFIDEIQYLRDWPRHLKSAVDTFAAYRFLVSGSAAATLRMQSRESGAGRFADVLMPPLSFLEYLMLRDDANIAVSRTDVREFQGDEGRKGASVDMTLKSDHTKLSIDAINARFLNYLDHGGFPEIVVKPDNGPQLAEQLANDIIDRVLLKDLPSLMGVRDPIALNSFFATLAYKTGSEFSVDGISKDTGLPKNTIRKYLEYLEAAFLIRRLHRMSDDGRRFTRQHNFKVYLTNPSLRAAIWGPLREETSPEHGHVVETAVAAHLLATLVGQRYYYARWKNGEVDFVQLDPVKGPNSPIEVKWREGTSAPALVAFCSQHGIDRAMLLSRSSQSVQQIGNLELQAKPVAHFCAEMSAWIFMGRAAMSLTPPPLQQP